MLIKNDYVLKDIVIMAMRYALPRRTYAFSQVYDFIRTYENIIDARTKDVMLRDLDIAITSYNAGAYYLDTCDINLIENCREWLERLNVK